MPDDSTDRKGSAQPGKTGTPPENAPHQDHAGETENADAPTENADDTSLMGKTGEGFVGLLVGVVIAVIVVFAVQAWVAKPYRIPSGSMEPTLQIGQRIIVNRFVYHFHDPAIGDIIVFHPPKNAEAEKACAVTVHGEQPISVGEPCPKSNAEDSGETFVKRIVAVGGDTISIKNGHPVVNGVEKTDEPYITPCGHGFGCDLPIKITVPEGDYFVMGDNRGNSDDSRFWGPIPRSYIIGKAFLTYWPLDRIGTL